MRICILDDVYDCPAWEAVPDDWRVDPTPFMKAHDFTVVGLTKETAVSTLTKSSRVETVFALRFQARRMMAKYGSALIEEFIEGREFTVLVAENPNDLNRPVTYTPIEFTFPEGERFKHSDMKWKDYHSMKEIPVKDPELEERLRSAGADFFLGMRGASFGRCDLRMNAEGEFFMLEINPNCGVYYAPSDPGSADLALMNDPAGHQGFTDLLIRSALTRHARRQRGWEVLPNPGNGFATYASRNIADGESIMRFEETPHTLASRSRAESSWDERKMDWFRRYALPPSTAPAVLRPAAAG